MSNIFSVFGTAVTGSGNDKFSGVKFNNLAMFGNITYDAGNASVTLTQNDQTVVNTAGASFVVKAQKGNGTGTGGSLVLSGGNGGAIGDGGTAALQGGLPTDGIGGSVTINGRDAAGTDHSGGSVGITSGNGIGLGQGGVVDIIAGNSDTGGVTGGSISIAGGTGASSDGSGGSIAITAGQGGVTDGSGGVIVVAGGTAEGSGIGGVATFKGGDANQGASGIGNGGQANIIGGLGGLTSGRGGDVNIISGNSPTNGVGGGVNLTAGASAGSNVGAAITITAGAASGGVNVGGDITLAPGAGAGGGAKGVINASTSFITNVVDPVNAQDAATKAYVDAAAGGFGFTRTGSVSTTTFTNIGAAIDLSTELTVDQRSANILMRVAMFNTTSNESASYLVMATFQRATGAVYTQTGSTLIIGQNETQAGYDFQLSSLTGSNFNVQGKSVSTDTSVWKVSGTFVVNL